MEEEDKTQRIECNFINCHLTVMNLNVIYETFFFKFSEATSIIKVCNATLMEFFLNVSLNTPNSVTKIFVITVKGLEPATSCVRD